MLIQLRRPLNTAIWYIGTVAIVAMFLIPVFVTIATSLKSDTTIRSFPPSWLFQPVPDHYKNVIYASGYSFPSFFVNSLVVAIITSFLVLIITLPAAYTMVRHGTGSGWFFSFVVSLRLLPPVVFIVPMFILFQSIGLIDTVGGLTLVNTLLNTPLALLLLVGFVQDLPREVEESAMIDGASSIEIIRRIVLPMLLPGLAVILVMTFMWTWNEFLFSLVLTFNRATTVTVGASLFVTAWGVRWGDIAAAITLSLIPTLIFTFIVQRNLVSGLTFGAVKE